MARSLPSDGFIQSCFARAVNRLDGCYIAKKFRFLSIEFVWVMASMQEIFNLMLARLAVLATLLRIAYGQTTTNH